MPDITSPRATYRLQFHGGFTFRDALGLVPYLDALGVSHLYASPIFRSTKGSTHGYDVTDYNQFDPEIGTLDDFFALSAELKKRGMSILLDFVPNHMGISGSENQWWVDVLENGTNSPYAKYFDIDWKPFQGAIGKQVLVPILGAPYGQVLERGELKVGWGDGGYHVDYLGTRLPLSPSSVFQLLEHAVADSEMPVGSKEQLLLEAKQVVRGKSASTIEARRALQLKLGTLGCEGGPLHLSIQVGLKTLEDDFDQLDALLSKQNYRLCYWKLATEEINYRRFFDVNGLAALRIEEPEVFTDAHRLLLELFQKKAISGVRVDHIDGLAFPLLYLERLRGAIVEVSEETQPPWILVEKILGFSEQLPADWPVEGTTGYEFVSEVTGLLIDSAAEKIITRGYMALTGNRQEFREEIYRSKRLVMQISMAGELSALGDLINQIAESHRWYRDFSLHALTVAVQELIACFPVYRSYLNPSQTANDTDRQLILKALALARRRNPGLDRALFEFLYAVLLPPENVLHPVDENLRQKFVLKFQQSTGPIMAKGVEDTAFYVYNRFSALNEVGSDPGNFGLNIEEFHRRNERRRDRYPRTLLATSTHDTKRGEDVRARLAVLSEMPRVWMRTLRRWVKLNRKHCLQIDGESAPDANEQCLLYQTLIGSWPLEVMDDEAHEIYLLRIQDYMVKALHEAKVNSAWIEPNEEWDLAVREFVKRILTRGTRNRFLIELEKMVATISFPGVINSLTQTVLKLTSPGVPDIYQGNEIWDWSLVDPDNRRPVDYVQRNKMLASLEGDVVCEELVREWRDGRIKMYVIRSLLQLRKKQPSLFSAGDYTPVAVTGSGANGVVAYLRREKENSLLVVVPRFSTHDGHWGDTRLDGIENPDWKNIFTGHGLISDTVADLWRDFPVAVFFGKLPFNP